MTGTVSRSARSGPALPSTHARSGSGEILWGFLAVAFAAYWTLFVAGAYSQKQELNDVGAVVILATLGWALLERLWVKIDAVAIACLIAAFLPLAVLLLTHSEPHPVSMVKHISLLVVMALARVMRLPPAAQSRMRYVLSGQVLIILLLSVTTDRGGVWDGGTRHSGLFANPNNLALIPFLLLFFIDRRRDPISIQVGTHLIVIAVLAWSGTSGAVMAYAIGLTIYFLRFLPRLWRVPLYTLAFLGGLALVCLVALGGEKMLPETRFTNQIAVMRTQLGTVLSGGEVAYYEQEKVLGPGAASGIWRLVHWRRTFTKYVESGPVEQIFGLGIGSSPALMGKLPHNEYLRVLFEQGICGLALFLFAWTRMIRTAPRDVRYCGIILAIYSFSENNMDNFPFMALFVLCLSAVEPVRQAEQSAPPRAIETYAFAS